MHNNLRPRKYIFGSIFKVYRQLMIVCKITYLIICYRYSWCVQHAIIVLS